MASPQPRASVHTPFVEAIDPHARTIEPRRRPQSQQARHQARGEGPRQAARMGSDRALCRDRRSGGEARSRSRRPLQHRLRGGLQGQARRAGGRPRRRQASSPRRSSATSSSTICSAGSRPMPGLVHARQHGRSGARANSTATCRSGITGASTHLLFFVLELNRLDDAKLEAAMADPELGYYRPWLEDIRKDKPYQLEDRVEQLFHEKSVTAYSAWNRLFDETIARLRFKVGRQVARDRADAQPVAGPATRTSARRRRRRWPRPSRRTSASSRSSPTRSPRTRRSPTAGAASPTSPTRGICPTASSPRWSTRW